MSNLLTRITYNENQCGGKPCVRGMRIRVSDVLSLLAKGQTTAEILIELPDLIAEDVQACLLFAITRIDYPIVKAA